MGRKIPGKKHRGVKDPYKQHAQRLAVLKSKTNKAPIRPDEQPIPRSLKQLMSWKNVEKPEQKKSDKIKNKTITKTQNKMKFLKKNTANPVKKLQLLDGESKKNFNMRITEAIKTLKNEATFKDIINDMPKEAEREPNEEEEKRFRRLKRKKKNDNTPKLTKSQKRTLREKEIKDQKKESKELDKMYLVKTDFVKFGEVVHEPPTLKIKPRKAETVEGAPRPARKDLLLNKIFENNNQSTQKSNVTLNKSKAIVNNGIDLKAKRKELPDNIRKNIEASQREAIEAYRQIKQNFRMNKKE